MKLKPKNPRIDKALETLTEATKDYQRGDLISYEMIEEAIEGVRNKGIWTSVVNKLKRHFERERGITLWCVVGTGYRLSTAKEQMNECPERRTLRARRQIARGINHLAALPTEELNTHQQRVRNDKVATHKRALSAVSRARREDKAIYKKSQTNFAQRKQNQP